MLTVTLPFLRLFTNKIYRNFIESGSWDRIYYDISYKSFYMIGEIFYRYHEWEFE